jgi:predicted  nucleic acid-binding Zn-ribbon protein
MFSKLKNLFNPAPTGVDDSTVQNFNQALEQLETEYKGQISVLEVDHQKQITDYQQKITASVEQAAQFHQQLSTLNDQIASLQDQLKASPTVVDASDPQVKIGHSEESFGKQLLKEMPSHLKDKIKKS